MYVTNRFKIEQCVWPFLLEAEILVEEKFKTVSLEKHFSALSILQGDWERFGCVLTLKNGKRVLFSVGGSRGNKRWIPTKERNKGHQYELASQESVSKQNLWRFHTSHKAQVSWVMKWKQRKQDAHWESCMWKTCTIGWGTKTSKAGPGFLAGETGTTWQSTLLQLCHKKLFLAAVLTMCWMRNEGYEGLKKNGLYVVGKTWTIFLKMRCYVNWYSC